jgi:predicted dehydrogenase
VNHIRACSNAEVGGFADVHAKRLEKAAGVVPGASIHRDYRSLLEDSSLDAVVVATPQHLRAVQFHDALASGKHVYLEKTMALTVEQAKQMRAAYQNDGGRRTVQIGHQATSTGHMTDVRQFLSQPGRMGQITAIAMQMHRNTPANKPQWARPALLTPDLTADKLDWAAFLGDATAREFDANRFVHWRYFWDYSGGTVFEHMSQQLSFWYGTLNLDIPQSATMKGGIYLWKDGRQVPDTVSVTLQQPEEILVSWVSGLGNNQLGVTEDVLGTHGSIARASQVRYVPQKVNRPDLQESVGRTAHIPQAHLQNFLDCVRLGGEPNCPFELGYRVSIACRMAVDSYREGRTVRWDSQREEIV